ncbi:MAG: hypothetical protein LBG76_08920, partial [Treponema sp.]|nr:hypothetical protein [Treponema sp.]
ALTDYRQEGKKENHISTGGAYGSWPAFLWLQIRWVYRAEDMNKKIDAAVAETWGSQTGFRVIYREAAE